MGKVVVASGKDLIKTKVRINHNMEEIDPITKQVISPTEKSYVPTPEEVEAARKKTEQQAGGSFDNEPASNIPAGAGLTEIIDALARKKVQNITKLVDERVVEILKESIK